MSLEGGRGGEGRGGEGRGGEGGKGGREDGGEGGRGGMTVIHIILMARHHIYRPTMKNYIYITMTSRIT